MSDPDLRAIIGLAGRPDTPLDVRALGNRLRRRRRRRNAVHVTASLVAIVVVVVGGRTVLGGLDRPSPVGLAAPTQTLVSVDPAVDALDGLAPLTAAALALEPTRLPDGYRRCSGPTVAAAVSITVYCAGASPPLSLARGPHGALPEVGEEVRVADRIGYLRRRDGRVEMTVSDDNGAADRHHQLRVASDADLQAGDMAAILASVPAIAQAPPPTER
ncbi:MAG TPA: hypothetical protein VMM13_11360 [Euzebya sp.]|nr:hypothetical protein [Euzebya sp.]